MDRRKLLRALLAALALVTVTVTLSIDNTDPNHPRPKVDVHIGKTTAVDNADQDAKPNDVVVLTPKAQAIANDFVADPQDLKGKLRGPDSGPVAKLLPPFAADEIPGCRTRFLKTNWSYRSAGAEPDLFWLHFTGGPDKPGTRSEVDGLTAYGNQASAGVSWHLNMDKDGNCDYNVPLRYKAWTEAGANSTGISIEVAGTGTGDYLRAGGLHELAVILHTVHERYPKIRVVLGGVANCSPTKPGIVTHWMGGPCSGGHTDIKPHDLVAVVGHLQAETAKLYPAGLSVSLRQARRSHRIVHAKIAKRCRGRARHSVGCQALFKRNGQLHAKYGKSL